MRNNDNYDEGRPVGEAIHATAVAISGTALLILGPSGSGKSRLALALIASSTPRRSILLLGDDRILLTQGPKGLIARSHPRIAGFIERRGLGIVASPFVTSATVGGLVVLGPLGRSSEGSKTSTIDLAQNFPCLRCVHSHEMDAEMVLRWWRGASTTLRAKLPVATPDSVKD